MLNSYWSEHYVRAVTGRIGPSGLCKLHGTKCSILVALFLSSIFFSSGLLFYQKGLSLGSEIWHVVVSHKKIRFGVNKIWGTLPPPGGRSYRFMIKRKVLKIT